MTLLAVDIGGTNTRFAQYHDHTLNNLASVELFRMPTQTEHVRNFPELLNQYQEQKPANFLELTAYTAICFSVPGPVYGDTCMPPNIPWDIDISSLKKAKTVYMINDFAAQAYACLIPEIQHDLISIREGLHHFGNTLGIIGAGTGIGHCTIVNNHIVASEAGHTTFSFIDDEEKAFEIFLKQKLNIGYCVIDNIVNGRGICYLHEFLTGEIKTANDLFNDPQKNQKTIDLFSRFYARAARNYCLSNTIDRSLIISGGLAAKNPKLITSDTFINEFMHLTAKAYEPLLKNIHIQLNLKDEIGVHGAAYYASTHTNAII